ncbi:uncharacterized protein P884DRAFT_298659 [Thermothelomyces heterothallicus CBS 202.75]|uniref:uncharacterized protein n=1 Tax=Thermothelomyces heterothallicus CBS 202.75 TaxID=1149848 RepID=UPI00374469BE
MDTFETSKPDRLHQSLSNAWASFLGAQQCGREIGSLRRALEEHARETNLSIASLQRDAATKNEVLSTAISDAKFKIDQHAAHLKEISVLPAQLSTLQLALEQDKEDTSKKISELSEKVAAQGSCLDGLQSSTSQELDAIQKQYRLALEEVVSLQNELREARADKLALEQRLAALENRVAALARGSREMPDDNVTLLKGFLPPWGNPMALLDSQRQHETLALGSVLPSCQKDNPRSQTPSALNGNNIREPPPRQIEADGQQNVGKDNLSPAVTKRTIEERTQEAPKRPRQHEDACQDIRSLYLVFRERYKTNPPKSDTAFIWQFMGSIEDQAMSKYIQESLAAMLPEHVTPCRDMRRKNPRKHVNISRRLTWRKFREALVNIPGPS